LLSALVFQEKSLILEKVRLFLFLRYFLNFARETRSGTQTFYNSQLKQVGDITPQGSSLGGGLFIQKCQTIDAVLSFSFHPFRPF
jgi:hypothetical protein